ncbi:hypothetical protein TrVE_jg308 [Triparma verrucosa]|uniref:NadR/Ttd14 AAA domain-containing protein n=1 Tax=Triparma verrucosa TaxID=1606542 RepID=A0A9W7ENV0_9STRA|nr:hypothetical protein TrVE_jg308 [Triparma verrucosa]
MSTTSAAQLAFLCSPLACYLLSLRSPVRVSSPPAPPSPPPPPPPILRFVLTGGPCGGKTTALARLSTYLRNLGFDVYTVPEASTLLLSNGAAPSNFSIDGWGDKFQVSLLKIQEGLEGAFHRLASATNRKSVLLCDRGLMDGKAYMSSSSWNDMLVDLDLNEVKIRDERYDAVFHLMSAAIGAEKFYTTENNEARTETVKEARDVDRRTQKAWLGHPRHHVFSNSSDFESKLRELVDAASKVCGLPKLDKGGSRKFLISDTWMKSLSHRNVNVQVFNVEKVYLYEDFSNSNSPPPPSSPSLRDSNAKIVREYSFIRRRTNSDNLRSHGQTTVQTYSTGETVEIKRIINSREYENAMRRRDPRRHVVRQERWSFLIEGGSFTVHKYLSPRAGLCVLHSQGKCEVPDWMGVVRELRGEEDERIYGAYGISLKEGEERGRVGSVGRGSGGGGEGGRKTFKSS